MNSFNIPADAARPIVDPKSVPIPENLAREKMIDAICAVDENTQEIKASLNAEIENRRAADAENAKQSKKQFRVSLSVAIFAVVLTTADMLLRRFGIL